MAEQVYNKMTGKTEDRAPGCTYDCDDVGAYKGGEGASYKKAPDSE